MEPQSGKNTKYVTGVTEYVVGTEQDYIRVDTSVNAVAIYLPNIQGSGILFNNSKKFFIIDESGNAATNNITIYPSGANSLNGAASFVMSTNNEIVECEPAGPDEYSINSSAASGSTPTVVTEITKDITGITFIDLTGQSGELIINVTSNDASNNLINFTNANAVTKITLRPQAAIGGYTLNVIDLVADPSGNIRLYAPSLPIYGNGEGFLTVENRSNNFYQVNYIDQYNP